MSEDFYADDSSDEISTEQLASDVADLRSQLDAIKAGASLREEIAMRTASEIAQAQPMYEPAQETMQAFTAATPQPRPRPVPPQISSQQVQDVTAKALSVVASTTDDWHSVAPSVMQRVQENPSRLSQLVPQGPLAVASYLSSLAVASKASNDTRAMKLAAQSAAGASGRPSLLTDAEQRWDEIVNASSGRLGL